MYATPEPPLDGQGRLNLVAVIDEFATHLEQFRIVMDGALSYDFEEAARTFVERDMAQGINTLQALAMTHPRLIERKLAHGQIKYLRLATVEKSDLSSTVASPISADKVTDPPLSHVVAAVVLFCFMLLGVASFADFICDLLF